MTIYDIYRAVERAASTIILLERAKSDFDSKGNSPTDRAYRIFLEVVEGVAVYMVSEVCKMAGSPLIKDDLRQSVVGVVNILIDKERQRYGNDKDYRGLYRALTHPDERIETLDTILPMCFNEKQARLVAMNALQNVETSIFKESPELRSKVQEWVTW